MQDRLVGVGLRTFMLTQFPERDMFLSPWLQRQSLSMIHAWRGLGKTHVSLGIAYAVAGGTSFLCWSADKPWRVLLVDGEMPGKVVQERFAGIIKAGGGEHEPPSDDQLTIITPDLQPNFMSLNLSTPEGQELLEPWTDGRDLIIIDNLSSLCRGGRENEAESWQPVAEWALRMRQSGKAVLFIHHSGKGGGQRGTSKKEDILDVVLTLKRPPNYSATEGARFEVHFEKTRGIVGEAVGSFEATMQTIEGATTWVTRPLDVASKDRVAELLALGMNIKDISNEMGISHSQVYRLNAALLEDGDPNAIKLKRGRKVKEVEHKIVGDNRADIF